MAVKRLRDAQRRRTRRAIVDAAAALLSKGETPTVADVAAAADVSRRTVYLYFPTFDQLLLDATVGALSQAAVDRAIDAGGMGRHGRPGGNDEDVESRVERMVHAIHQVSPEAERLGRSLVRLTIDAPPPEDGAPRRGYRRLEWLETAVAPLRARIAPARFRRLINALAMIVGWEALIVQRDVCGLTAREGEAVSVWAARALVRAAIRERPRR